jgi:hypothetical protein
MKGQVLFKGEIIKKNVKMGLGLLKTIGPILTRLNTNHH